MHYNYHRYYDPTSGRYVSVDPIGFEDEEVNLYGYVRNNPTIYIDPVGLKIPPSCRRIGPLSWRWTRGLEYEFDQEKCMLNVTMIWDITFVDYSNKGPWTDIQQENWKRNAERILEDYFSHTGYRCYPNRRTCCICPGGADIEFDLIFYEQYKKRRWYEIWKPPGVPGPDYRYNIVVDTGNIPDRRARGGTHKRNGVIIGGQGRLSWGDLIPSYRGGPEPMIPIVHETGHMLGLEHPGIHMFPDNPRPPACFTPSYPGDDSWEYDADPGSLMGRGMQLRASDFREAFCDHIKTKKANCDPWFANTVRNEGDF